MLFIQESKLPVMDQLAASKLWRISEMEMTYMQSDGAAGGLISMWNTKKFKIQSQSCHRNFILIRGVLTNMGVCTLVNIYAPNDVVQRRQLWTEILELKDFLRSLGLLEEISMKSYQWKKGKGVMEV